jgi:hypothetical protein
MKRKWTCKGCETRKARLRRLGRGYRLMLEIKRLYLA